MSGGSGSRVKKLVLRGPLERDIQALILASLGVEQRELRTDKRGRQRWASLNVWIGRDGSMWWRANSGVLRSVTGAPVRMNAPGCADIIGVVDGVPVAFEVKREHGRQSATQRRWQAWWEAAGGVYRVVRSMGEARDSVCAVRQVTDA